jgi:hypothetical protein
MASGPVAKKAEACAEQRRPKGLMSQERLRVLHLFRIYGRSLPPTPAGMTRPYPLPVTPVSLRILRGAVVADQTLADVSKTGF